MIRRDFRRASSKFRPSRHKTRESFGGPTISSELKRPQHNLKSIIFNIFQSEIHRSLKSLAKFSVHSLQVGILFIMASFATRVVLMIATLFVMAGLESHLALAARFSEEEAAPAPTPTVPGHAASLVLSLPSVVVPAVLSVLSFLALNC